MPMKSPAARDFLEQLYREMVVRIGQVARVSVASVAVVVDAIGQGALEEDWDYRVVLRARELDDRIRATFEIRTTCDGATRLHRAL